MRGVRGVRGVLGLLYTIPIMAPINHAYNTYSVMVFGKCQNVHWQALKAKS